MQQLTGFGLGLEGFNYEGLQNGPLPTEKLKEHEIQVRLGAALFIMPFAATAIAHLCEANKTVLILTAVAGSVPFTIAAIAWVVFGCRSSQTAPLPSEINRV